MNFAEIKSILSGLLKVSKPLLASVLTIFAPSQSVLIMALLLILVDTVMGVWAAKKRGEQINSSGFRRGISKIATYEFALAIAFLTQIYLTGPTLPVFTWLAGLVGLTELTSILENIGEIGGEKSFFAQAIAKLGRNKD